MVVLRWSWAVPMIEDCFFWNAFEKSWLKWKSRWRGRWIGGWKVDQGGDDRRSRWRSRWRGQWRRRWKVDRCSSPGTLRRRSITRDKTNFTNKENEKAQTPKAQRRNLTYTIMQISIDRIPRQLCHLWFLMLAHIVLHMSYTFLSFRICAYSCRTCNVFQMCSYTALCVLLTWLV